MSKKRLRIKYITEKEFELIKRREWSPVELTYNTLPNWVKSIPEDKRRHVYASGSGLKKLNHQYAECKVVGGIDIFRNAKSEIEPVDWNKDHYVIIRTSENDDALLVIGPLKDNEHWINEIPGRFRNVEILSLDKK
jgi:hypothetical protein